MDQQQPGQVITPGGTSPSANEQLPPVATPSPAVVSQPIPQPTPTALQEIPQPVQTQPLPAPEPSAPQAANVVATPELAPAPQQVMQEDAITPELSWNAAEFIHAEKGPGWYAAYALGVVLISALIFVFTHDFISSGAVLIAGFGLMYVLARKPHEQTYMLHDGQLAIGRKWYNLHDFKAYSTKDEAEAVEVTLSPLKRFMPPVTIYLDKSNPDAVLGYISQYLPNEQTKPDAVDKMLTRLRF